MSEPILTEVPTAYLRVIDYLKGMIKDSLDEIPKDIERIKNSDLSESLKDDQIAFKEGMQCAFQIVQKCL